jgi:hypothetical protein
VYCRVQEILAVHGSTPIWEDLKEKKMDRKLEKITRKINQVGNDIANLAAFALGISAELDEILTNIEELNKTNSANIKRKPISEEQKELIVLLKSCEKVEGEFCIGLTGTDSALLNKFMVRTKWIGYRLGISAAKAGRLIKSIGIARRRSNWGWGNYWTEGDLERIEKEMEK